MDYGHSSLRGGSVSGPGTYFNGADPYTPAPTGSAGSGQRALDGPGYPHMVPAPGPEPVSLACWF